MKLKFWDFLGGKREDREIEYIITGRLQEAMAIGELAYEICVQRIAKAICKCEFRTYKNHEEVKDKTYYTLNERPNHNQTATEFWQSVVEKLYKNQEALIVEVDEMLYLADSFTLDDKDPTKPYAFKQVSIGNKKLDKSFSAKDVAYLKLSNKKVKTMLYQVITSYTGLIQTATNAYKNGVGMKAKMHIGRAQDAMSENAQKALKEGLSKFFNDPNSCFMEYEGYDFQPFDTSRKGIQQSSRDIKAMLDDVLELTSKAFLIPSNIATGEVTDTSKAVDDFLTFCLDSVISLLEDALNNALYQYEHYSKGTYIKINAQTIKHVDVLDASGSIDKLISSGAYCINDIRRIMDDEPIGEEWANQHYITKNYTSIANLDALESENTETNTLKGGEDDEENENGVQTAG